MFMANLSSLLSIDFTYLREIFLNFQPFVVVFNSLLGLTIGAISLHLLFRTRPRVLKSQLLKPGAVVINWSGHPLPRCEWIVPFKVHTPENAPHFCTDSWLDIQRSVQNMFRQLPRDLQVRMLQGDPDVIIVIPQLAAGLSVLLAVLHGQTGVFPTITCPMRKEGGTFWLPEPISLSEIRINSRLKRDPNIL